jgi:hypothetical protein
MISPIDTLKRASESTASSAPESLQSASPRRRYVACLALIILASAYLNSFNNSFPLGYHYDEPKKVRFVKTGTQDFHHPILMLQLTRLVNSVWKATDDQTVVILGRTIVGICGCTVVLLTYWLCRGFMPAGWALLPALATAISPTIVIHAHYFKEDIVYTAAALLSLLAFRRHVRYPTLASTLLLGIATGLALSSHYKSVILPILYVVFPAMARSCRPRAYYTDLAIAMLISGYVFLLVNFPLVDDPMGFLRGVHSEAQHVVQGHIIRISPLDYGFCFHLFHSLVPGMTVIVASAAVLGLVYSFLSWRRQPDFDRLLLVFVITNYLVVEISPCKPAPDFERYVLPIVPLLIAFLYKGLSGLWQHAASARFRLALGAFGTATLVVPLADTILLDHNLVRDPRAAAESWLDDKGEKAVFEAHSGRRVDTWSVAGLDVDGARANGTAFFVASQFSWRQYCRGSRLKEQPADVYRLHRQYEWLFSHYPYVEFRPAYRDFAFSNPVVRVVDIRKSRRPPTALEHRPSGKRMTVSRAAPPDDSAM